MTMKLRFTGDGKYQETAIWFKNAMSMKDFTLMQALFLKSKGLKVRQKFVKTNINGYTYDVYFTHSGYVWFKKPYIDPAITKNKATA